MILFNFEIKKSKSTLFFNKISKVSISNSQPYRFQEIFHQKFLIKLNKKNNIHLIFRFCLGNRKKNFRLMFFYNFTKISEKLIISDSL
ncbi:hypothetical protein BpHYR1_051095 [Brachionus plicatilis]|uniref:Uncharacterized protein n=1 Tax=Brachionus plicatilis TaxID=10195 RepID=A0A3M7RUC7_BRAPC|nr:hypothetical protein BpHYR1_051095 [Brachionus plicatilis]